MCQYEGMYFIEAFKPRWPIPLFLSGYKISNKTSCTTVTDFSGKKSNKTCIFPFKLLGITYNRCVWCEKDTKARCPTLTGDDGSVELIPDNWGVCEPACQPKKLSEDTNEESKKVGKDSSMVSIVIISITVLILSSITMVYCCYVKRKRGKEISNADGIGLQEIDSKYSNHLFVQIFITSVLRFCKIYEIITNTYLHITS